MLVEIQLRRILVAKREDGSVTIASPTTGTVCEIEKVAEVAAKLSGELARLDPSVLHPGVTFTELSRGEMDAYRLAEWKMRDDGFHENGVKTEEVDMRDKPEAALN